MSANLDQLIAEKRSLKESIASYFRGDASPNRGDRGYQELLENLEAIQAEIDNLTDQDTD
jgi:hypothetical protein